MPSTKHVNLSLISERHVPIPEVGRKMGDSRNIKTQHSFPKWKNHKGEDLPTEELKKVCANWSSLDWENYLKYLEAPLKEKLFVSSEQKAMVMGITSTEYLFDTIKQENIVTPIMESAIQRILRLHLSKREQEIIWLKYWDGRSQREIAKSLNLTRRTVRTLIERAHRKIESQIFLNSVRSSKYFRELDITGS